MGLFKSKDDKQKEIIDKLSKPYLNKGFKVSKQLLIQNAALFLIDTENKKWAYTNLEKEKSNIVKIYDFKDLSKYEANQEDKQGNFQSTSMVLGLLSTTTNKRHVYNIKAFINTTDIDDSIIQIMDISFDSDSLMAWNKYDIENLYNEITKCLEYIINNK